MPMSVGADHNYDYCLIIDFTGMCFQVPFQRQALPYFFFMIAALGLSFVIAQRMVLRALNSISIHPESPDFLKLFHLHLGRLGMLLLTSGTFLDNLRIFVGSWDAGIWPHDVRDLAVIQNNVTMANQVWQTQYNYQGCSFQVVLTWACLVVQIVLAPIALHAILNSFYNFFGRPLRRHFGLRISRSHWLTLSNSIVLFLMGLGLLDLLLGPLKGQLELTTDRSNILLLEPSIPAQTFNAFLWEGAFMGLAMLLFLTDYAANVHQHFGIFIINILCLLLFRHARSAPNDRYSWRPCFANLALLLIFVTQLWMDSLHNPEHVMDDEESDNSNSEDNNNNGADDTNNAVALNNFENDARESLLAPPQEI